GFVLYALMDFVVDEMVDMLRELLTTALEANLSLVSVAQNEAMKRLAGGDHRGADGGGGRLRHELQVHARARLALRLPACGRRDARGVRIPRLPRQALRLALSRISGGLPAAALAGSPR